MHSRIRICVLQTLSIFSLIFPSLCTVGVPAMSDTIKIEETKNFVNLIIKEWEKQSGTTVEYQLDEEKCLLNVDGFQLNIQSLLASYEDASSQAGYVTDFISNLLESREKKLKFEDVKKSIFPLVRSTKWFDTQDMYMKELYSSFNNQDNLPFFPRKEANLYLSVGLLVSLPREEGTNVETVLRYVTSNDLLDWNKTLDDLLPIAMNNLTLSKVSFEEDISGVWTAGDRWDSDANIMFFPNAFKELSLKGSPIAIHPHQGWVIATGSEDIEGLKRAFQISDDLSEMNKALSGHIFILSSDTWDIFIPDEAHPLYNEIYLRNLKADELDSYYLENCIREELVYQGDEDTYVSSFQVNEGALESFAVILNKKKSIFPIVNSIVLDVFPEDISEEIFQTCVIPFKRFLEICVHRMSKFQHSNDYVVLNGFPSEEELIKLGIDVEYIRSLP